MAFKRWDRNETAQSEIQMQKVKFWKKKQQTHKNNQNKPKNLNTEKTC